MSKYKVGDRVVVISREKVKNVRSVRPSFIESMEKFCGETATISRVFKSYSSYDFYEYEIEEDNGGHNWYDEFFEGLEKDIKKEPNDKIFPSIFYDEFDYLAAGKIPAFHIPPFSLDLKLKKENNIMNKKDILAVRNYNDRAMVMQFDKKDKNDKNIQTRAEVQDGDIFDLDEGIKTCLLKYLLGGHKQYMAIMDAARKSYKRTVKADQKKAKEKEKAIVSSVLKGIQNERKQQKMSEEKSVFIANAIKKALKEYDEEKTRNEATCNTAIHD